MVYLPTKANITIKLSNPQTLACKESTQHKCQLAKANKSSTFPIFHNTCIKNEHEKQKLEISMRSTLHQAPRPTKLLL
jgi:hypothetical protein